MPIHGPDNQTAGHTFRRQDVHPACAARSRANASHGTDCRPDSSHAPSPHPRADCRAGRRPPARPSRSVDQRSGRNDRCADHRRRVRRPARDGPLVSALHNWSASPLKPSAKKNRRTRYRLARQACFESCAPVSRRSGHSRASSASPPGNHRASKATITELGCRPSPVRPDRTAEADHREYHPAGWIHR